MKSIFTTFNLKDPGTNRPVDLLASMRILFDEATKSQKTLWEQTYVDRWFTVRPPQLGLTVEGIMASYGIRVRAALIGNDSMTPLRTSRGFETWKGEIPRFGHKFKMTAKVMRQLMQVYESNHINPEAKIREIENVILGEYKDAYMGCKDVADEIILKALSGGGVALFDPAVDNPEGREYMVDFDLPIANKRAATVEWSEANVNNPSIDVLGDIQKIVYDYKTLGIEFDSMLMAPQIKHWLIRSLPIRQAALGIDKGARIVSLPEFDALVRSMGIPPIVEINKRTAYQKDGIPNILNPWNDDVIAFLPRTADGKLGEVQPALEDSAIMPDPTVDYTDAGDGITIAKWRQGESTGVQVAEFTQGTWRAIPVLTSAKAVVNYKVRNIAVSYPTGEVTPLG
ncbi:MAG: hypothetical protein LBP50_03220 [Tannerella sp.]|jgi:hypothetical protein|nr:hypothetical protein [Tannerella sp.]